MGPDRQQPYYSPSNTDGATAPANLHAMLCLCASRCVLERLLFVKVDVMSSAVGDMVMTLLRGFAMNEGSLALDSRPLNNDKSTVQTPSSGHT
jgi:hypothetical protein